MSSEDLQQFNQLLTQNGYRVTGAREATFRLLLSPEPQTMSQLLDKAKPHVDRVSVYRNIDLFEKLGIVHRVYVGWKYKLELTDLFMSHHHHLSCLGCGMVIDIEDEQHVEDFIQKVAQRFNFVPKRHQFEVEGYCQNCQQKPALAS
jgi:Fe2+ or Zn2+ uptake regulation protein